MKRVILILAGISLNACFPLASTLAPMFQGQIVALRLNVELTFAPEQVALYVQDGKLVPANSVDAYRPNCVFELYRRPLSETRIPPSRFRVERVRLDFGVWQGLRHNAAVRDASMGGDDSPSHVEYATEFFLRSASQPPLYRVTCKHWENPERARHLSTGEIISALGPLFTVITQH